MNITYNKETNIFHLTNELISYVIGVLPNGHLSHLYYGAKLTGPLQENFFHLRQFKAFTDYIVKDRISLNLEKLEYPCFGTTDLRTPAFEIESETGSKSVDFIYERHNIYKGKKKSTILPNSHAKDDEVITLEIITKDNVLNAEMKHSYSIFKNLSVIVRKTSITNNSSSSLRIHKAMSMSMDISSDYNEWIQLSGDWAKERHIIQKNIDQGITKIDSKSGSSSSKNNPSVILQKSNTNEHQGEAIGVNLIYSGNFEILAEQDQNNIIRLMAGINSFRFNWELKESETFETPEVSITYSNKGLNQLSQMHHTFILNHIINQKWHTQKRPILINNWEATYFDFTEESILNIAEKAKEVGVDMFVLDDGWFGQRNNDKAGLGDWYVNTDKLKNGLDGLSQKINEMGLKFGLWIEPEMVNPISDLYKEHPDYVVQDPLREKSFGRFQYVLDFSRKEVVDNIYNQLIKIFDKLNLSYVKWDMNRTISEPYSLSLSKNNQGEFYHRYILGVYDLYERLTNRYPDILFESCSAGGNRFDTGLLYYAPQAWTSDNTDAYERLKIQYGTSLFYPLSSMGSHISAVPNHQTFRSTSLKFRNDVAMFGTYGFELDLNKLDENEIGQVKEYIKQFIENQSLIHNGNFYRIHSPFNGNNTTWMVVDNSQSNAIVGHYLGVNPTNQGLQNLKLVGLNPDTLYNVESELFNGKVSGSVLMNNGIYYTPSSNGVLKTRKMVGDFQSYIIKISVEE